MTQEKLQFTADRLDIRTRKSDNAIIVTFETGEYSKNIAALLFALTGDHSFKVTVEPQ